MKQYQAHEHSKFKTIPKFKIDLDEAPENRWNAVVKAYKNKFDGVMNVMDKLLEGFMGTILSWVTWYNSDRVFYIEELKAISEKSGVALERLIILQLCYELFACCTSVLINENDKIIHYRTMDWEMPELKDLTIDVDFVRKGHIIFSATTWAGYVGVMTATKPDVCTVALNYRRLGDGVLTNYTKSVNGSWPVGFLIRHLLETENDYNKIKGYLSHSPLISPCYLTIGGSKAGQGVVLSRTRESVDKIQNLGQADKDFLVQTNIDHDREIDPTVSNIMYSTQRIDNVKKIMKKYVKTFDLNNVINTFNVWPIINESTIYVTVMCCADDRMCSYIC